MSIELKIPEVGESVAEAQIARWLVAEGDFVKKDDTIAELDTDKVTVELPAPESGTLSKILKSKGDTAEVGEVIGYLEPGSEGAGGKSKSAAKTSDADKKANASSGSAKTAASGKSAKPDKAGAKSKADPNADADADKFKIMPAAARLLDEHDLDADEVTATGPGGRLLKEDVLSHLEKLQKEAEDAEAAEREAEEESPKKSAARVAGPSAAATPKGFFGADREEEIVPMSPIRKRIAQRLVSAQQDAALLTTFNECDLSSVMALRKQYQDRFVEKHGVKLGFMSFFVKASIEALKQFPAINAEIRGDDFAYKNFYDIGIAVSTERGLVVPVIRNADRLSFAEVEQTIGDFGKRARENKLKLEELEGGTFTITNGGIFGSLLSTPIVNPPQSGVLGMHSIQERPVAINGQVVIRPMMYTALSYDHRIVDGRGAVSFLKTVKELIEDPTRILIET